MILLKGIFFIFLAGLLFVAVIVLSVVVKIYRLRQQLRKQGNNTWERTSDTQKKDGGTTVCVRRDPAKANKKIFSDDEGEYIDYVEE